MEYTNTCLLSENECETTDNHTDNDKTKILSAFKVVISDPMRAVYDKPRREILAGEIAYYVKGVETEQRLQRRDTVPSIDEYCAYRMASSAVRFVLCVNEYVVATCIEKISVCGNADSDLWVA
jgi:hypothetical protein